MSIELEKNPSDKEISNAIFRPVHSLKGNAAYFGLLKKSVWPMNSHRFSTKSAKVYSNLIKALSMHFLKKTL